MRREKRAARSPAERKLHIWTKFHDVGRNITVNPRTKSLTAVILLAAAAPAQAAVIGFEELGNVGPSGPTITTQYLSSGVTFSSDGGNVNMVPTYACTVGPRETWKADKVSIWHPGHHDNPFGMRLSSLMISKRIVDSSCPMSLLADHPNVQFNFLRSGVGNVSTEMH